MLTLRDYQRQSLDTLAKYLRLVVERDNASTAFYEITERPYHKVPKLENMPYVCLRVPTGGGKTFMACHAVGIVAREYLRAERTLCLWLVPSNAIREQTLNALRNPRHSYRQALDSAFGGNVTVMDLAEALYLQRGTLDSDTVVVVTTLQSPRVAETDSRKVYEDNGALQHHFDTIPDMMRAVLESESGGRPLYSLANVLRMRRPMVVMDEAHNARTPLTFDTLTRFYPSCIVEFTATPETKHNPRRERFASNVLHHVSARELREAEMIKLPINLRTRGDWHAIVGDALETESKLRALACDEEKETGEHIRPIILFQAQSVNGEDVNVNVLKRSLIEDFKKAEDEIAIATGETRGIEGMDLFDPKCRIRYIITVKALAEGWDCSFAYVLCSVSAVSTPRAVEQILGRILRLPNAKRKRREELNCAYAFAASDDFFRTAASLKDALIEGAGFQRMEAADFVQAEQQQDFGPLFTAPGGASIPSRPPTSIPFAIPLLGIRVGKQLEIFDDSHLLADEWNLAAVDAPLSDADFPSVVSSAQEGQIDAGESGKVEVHFVRDLHQQLSFVGFEPGWTLPSFANWLDRHTQHVQIPQRQSSVFIHKLVTDLMKSRGLAMEQLARDKFRLAEAIHRSIDGLLRGQAAKGFQRILLEPARMGMEVSPELCLRLSEDHYAPSQFYEGPYQFRKHLFRLIGDMNGEEAECAARLDGHPRLDVWVRNVDRGPRSFWLQTSTDRFYPDFVARLTDGRYLVVEYKRARDWTNEDSVEKRAIGALWADRSAGRCLFVMPSGPDWEALSGAVKF